jgi:hypothetical protein
MKYEKITEISENVIDIEKGYQLRRTIIVFVFDIPLSRLIFSRHSLTSVMFNPDMVTAMSYSPVIS